MVGGGPFHLKPGQWTDDTSMALCLAESLTQMDGFDARDQMERYCRWNREGYLSSTGRCFDIGGTVRAALEKFQRTGDPFAGPTDPRSAGNGCIMRLAPVPMFFYPDRDKVVEMSGQSSRTTHGALECLEACRLLGAILCTALSGAEKQNILKEHGEESFQSERILSIARGDYLAKERKQVRGTGYVVECLEAALWCFHKGANFEDAILRAANLGDDADTTAAVCGQLAGAYYGEGGIPSRWLDRLFMADRIRALADRLLDRRGPA